ncbi:unnamed protein product, partial [Owenia fusiformis]
MSPKLWIVIVAVFYIKLTICCESLSECPPTCFCCHQGLKLNMTCLPGTVQTMDWVVSKDILVEIYWTFSGLISIPGNLSEFEYLTDVVFAFNAIQTIPVGIFQGAEKLENLILRNNNITRLEHGCFSGLVELEVLDLSNNLISYLYMQPGVFTRSQLPKLQHILLQNNYLAVFEPCPLLMPLLQSVNFSSNNIAEFSNEMNFSILHLRGAPPGAVFIDFQHNQFKSINVRMFVQYGIQEIDQLWHFWSYSFDYRNNPFHCDCQIYKIARFGR